MTTGARRYSGRWPTAVIPSWGNDWSGASLYYGKISRRLRDSAGLTLRSNWSDDQTPTDAIASLKYAEASLGMSLGRYEVWLASSANAVALYRAVGDPRGVARAQHRQANALSNLGRFSEARSLLEEALSLARSEGNRRPVGWILRSLATVCAQDGDPEAARAYVTEALESYKALDAPVNLAWTLNHLADIEHRAGNAELALQYTNDELATMRAFYQPRGVAVALDNMPTYLISLGRYGEAEKIAREALAHAREHHLDVYAQNALQGLAELAILLRPESKSEVYARAARILGFVDARRQAAAGTEHDVLDARNTNRLLEIVRDSLGGAAVARLTTEGASMTDEQVDEQALRLG